MRGRWHGKWNRPARKNGRRRTPGIILGKRDWIMEFGFAKGGVVFVIRELFIIDSSCRFIFHRHWIYDPRPEINNEKYGKVYIFYEAKKELMLRCIFTWNISFSQCESIESWKMDCQCRIVEKRWRNVMKQRNKCNYSLGAKEKIKMFLGRGDDFLQEKSERKYRKRKWVYNSMKNGMFTFLHKTSYDWDEISIQKTFREICNVRTKFSWFFHFFE